MSSLQRKHASLIAGKRDINLECARIESQSAKEIVLANLNFYSNEMAIAAKFVGQKISDFIELRYKVLLIVAVAVGFVALDVVMIAGILSH